MLAKGPPGNTASPGEGLKLRRGLQCARWTSIRQAWLAAGVLRLAEEAVLSACPRKDLERKAGEGSSRKAEEARGGGCVRTGRSGPAELPDAGSRAPEPAEPSRPPLLLVLLHPSGASAPARLPPRAPRRCPLTGRRPDSSCRAPLPASLSSAAPRRAACPGGGTATRTTVSALSRTAEAAPTRGPRSRGLEERDGKPPRPTHTPRQRLGDQAGRAGMWPSDF